MKLKTINTWILCIRTVLTSNIAKDFPPLCRLIRSRGKELYNLSHNFSVLTTPKRAGTKVSPVTYAK